ncbi:Protein priB [Colletotrichum siamense]|nr:Protein priB [Colletotrichum siamense]
MPPRKIVLWSNLPAVTGPANRWRPIIQANTALRASAVGQRDSAVIGGSPVRDVLRRDRHAVTLFDLIEAAKKAVPTSKPDSLEKLLARINESPVKDQVIAAIVNSLNTGSDNLSPPLTDSPGFQNQGLEVSVNTTSRSESPELPDTTQVPCPCFKLERESHVVSPLQIMAAAIAADLPTTSLCPSHTSRSKDGNGLDERLVEYLTPRSTHQKDWHVLASQSNNTTLRLESTACDPVTARLVDQSDVSLYFDLFFNMRNPLVGLLDPVLHTPESVYNASFTLFSVICALGCAISTRPRDRILYPTLLSLAEASMMWSIAASVKSLEIIQAIICMKYWAPLHQRQADDPYWLHLGHAAQLAKELGINRPSAVTEQANALAPDASTEFKERMMRNIERTWLYVFIADKSFGIATGRSLIVGWNELPPCPCQWWKKPMTNPSDRMISGLIEIRVQLLEALKQLGRGIKTPEAVLSWHSKAFEALESTRNKACSTDDPRIANSLPILAFYMDHSIMVLNAQAMRDLKNIDEEVRCAEFLTVSRRAFDVARRALELALSDSTMRELRLGWHNNQFIMVAHAMTEILHAIKRGNLPPADVVDAAAKVRSVPRYLEDMAQELPDTSAVHFYTALSRVFASQVEKFANIEDQNTDLDAGIDTNLFVPEWLKEVNGGSLDPALWFDVGFLSVEQPSLGSADLGGVEDLDNLTFN